MSIPQSGGGPIEDPRQLTGYLEAGCKPKAEWKIGTEHEKFGFCTEKLAPVPYEGKRGVRAMLEGLMRFGWQGVYEGETLVGLSMNGASVSLEPGSWSIVESIVGDGGLQTFTEDDGARQALPAGFYRISGNFHP